MSNLQLRSDFRLQWVLGFAALFVSTASIAKEQSSGNRASTCEPEIRELFVPLEHLKKILDPRQEHVLVTREEYQALVAKARPKVPGKLPAKAVVRSSDYEISVELGHTRIAGALEIEVLAEGLQAVALGISATGLRSAAFDGRGAALTADRMGDLTLLVEGRGRHTLLVDFVLPIEVEAAQQTLAFEYPAASATRLKLNVVGNVEIKSGAEVMSRKYDAAAGITRFELLPRRGSAEVVMNRNNRLVQQQRVVVARSLLVDELTEAYERLHATFSFDVLQGATDRFRLAIPVGFEVTRVESPLLARWQVEPAREPEGATPVLEITLREPTTEEVVVHLTAIRTPSKIDAWSLPKFEPLEIAGHTAVVSLLVEDRLKPQTLEARGLIPVDSARLTSNLPIQLLDGGLGTPPLRPLATYYAPRPDFSLQAQLNSPASQIRLTTNVLLVLRDAGLSVEGGFALLPETEELFRCRFSIPPGWQITELASIAREPLAFQRYAQTSGSRIEVELPQGVSVGESYSIYFKANFTPPGWLDRWQTTTVTFPFFEMRDAKQPRGAIAVQAWDDLVVRPEKLVGLTPLDEDSKWEHGFADWPTNLAYQFQNVPVDAVLTVERNEPRVTARTFSMLQLEPDELVGHYEINYDILEARAQRLSFLLPATTPAELTIAGLEGLEIKEYQSQLEGDRRRWIVYLQQGVRGAVRLAADFRQPRANQADEQSLPVVCAGDVIYQSGVVVVEGSPELEMQFVKHPRKIDVGELVDAQYQPGKHLLGAFGFSGEVGEVKIKSQRVAGYELPAGIVQRVELVTLVSTSGTSQTAARFLLRSKAAFVEVQLPAQSRLWSVRLDNQPNAPQRQGDRILVSLGAGSSELRDLQIVYEMPISTLRLWGNLELSVPRLLLCEEGSTATGELPVADLTWHLLPPAGYRLVQSAGNVFTEALSTKKLPMFFSDRISGSEELWPKDAPAASPQIDRRGKPAPNESPGQDTSPFASSQSKNLPNKVWALEGIRSLPIDLDDTGPKITFRSLGAEPQLKVTLVHDERMRFLGWGTGLGLLVIGLALSASGINRKPRFAVAVIAIAALAPVLIDWPVWNQCFYMALGAGLGLLVYFAMRLLVAHGYRYLTSAWGACLILAWLGTLASPAPAQMLHEEQENQTAQSKGSSDSVIVPYDSSDPEGPAKATKLLVPYKKYLELWNAVHPKQPLEARKLSVPFALAGAQFTTTLADEDFLSVSGYVDIDLLADGVHQIPLRWSGGVLMEATVDGKPARLEIVEVDWEAARLERRAPQPAKPRETKGVLYLSNPGRQRLELTMRFPLERQGGWRIARGRLPSASAIGLEFLVPQAGTELRMAGLGQDNVETTSPNETIQAALGAGGAFGFQWRAKVSEATVDESLTVKSDAILDVQEDGLRMIWHLDLEFGRGLREAFTLLLPPDYLVEKIQGDNVRGWQLKGENARQRVVVTLLHAARQRDSFTVRLMRRGAIEKQAGSAGQFTVPTVEVEDAALHHGQVSIRRSPALSLRTISAEGLTRTDQGESPAGLINALEEQEIPLGIRAYQTYRFIATPVALRLSAEPMAKRTQAHLQTVLSITAQERSLECRVSLRSEGRAIDQARLLVPENLKLTEVVAPEPFDWSVAPFGTQQLVTIFRTTGLQHEFPVILRGTLGDRGPAEVVPLPQLELLDVASQEMELVVQADPSLEVHGEQLQSCDSLVLERTYAWFARAQRPFTRFAVHCRGANYSGAARVGLRTPKVRCTTVSNVRVTDRAFEETILLDYTIRDAGIDRISFLLPEPMRDARIRAPLLQQKTVEEVVDAAGRKQLRVTLHFQDEMLGQLRVLVENDRAASTSNYIVPLPKVEHALTDRCFVTLESAGRDEILIDRHPGFELLSREQSDWRRLTTLLEQEISQAFVADGADEGAALEFHTKDRAAVETAGARIGLAQALLTLDAAGAYRAQQIYRMDNSTEQFLEVAVPAGAELWAASVAGDPVKLARVPGRADRVRIPLLKTAAGDQDFAVVLKYGGQLDTMGRAGRLRFPMLRTVNVNVELSQVRLRLPESHHWFNFDGTMRRVANESELTAGVAGYQARLIERLSRLLTLPSSSSYEKIRASNNLEQLSSDVELLDATDNQVISAKKALEAAKQQMALEQRNRKRPEQDNRARLNDSFEQQERVRAKDLAPELGANFRLENSDFGQSSIEGEFDEEWLEQHGLEVQTDSDDDVEESHLADELETLAQPVRKRKSYDRIVANQADFLKGGEGASGQKGGLGSVGGRGNKGGNSKGKGGKRIVSRTQAGDDSESSGSKRLFSKGRVGKGGKGGKFLGGDSRADAEGNQGGDSERWTGGESNQGGESEEDAFQEQLVGPEIGLSQSDAERERLKQEFEQGETRLNSGVQDRLERYATQLQKQGPGAHGNLPRRTRLKPFEGEQPPDSQTEFLEGAEWEAGLASLDVDIPDRGIEILLTTPRGEVEITAQAVSWSLIERLMRLAIALAGLGVVLLLVRLACNKQSVSPVVGNPSAS